MVLGTKKGLFLLESEAGGGFDIRTRAFTGQPVDFAIRDQRSGRLFAAVTSPFYGPKLFYTDTDGASESDWAQAEGVSLPTGGEETLERIWVIAPAEAGGALYMGAAPGVLFESEDGGAHWEINAGLWNEPSRAEWQPGGGGLCLHSICTWPDDPDKLAVAVSAAGVWLTEDRGRTWRRGNRGLVPRYLPEAPGPAETNDLCVHHLERAPRRPQRLFMQFHGGVYRSDDAGESWNEIGTPLPSDFGFPLVVDPADPDCAYVIPLTADVDRVTPESRVRIYETRDAGSSWEARATGLPSQHAYLTVLRQAFTRVGEGERLELYFGSTTGDLFGSADAGASWSAASARLPPIFSVTAGAGPNSGR